MANRPPVHCRVCGKAINRDMEQEGVVWMQPSKNWYYHCQCYADFARKKKNLHNDVHAEVDNDLWFATLYDYLTKELKMELNMSKVASQWQNFLKKGFTAKGIYFCIRYFYEVQHNDTNKSDGIGIVTYIYKEGCQYWVDREQKERGICAKIEAQVRHAEVQKKVVIKQGKKEKKKGIDLMSIASMEDEA